MFQNYIKIALRNIKKYKGYSAINILGLSFGLAISIIIGFYVVDDLTFDRMHDSPENIYRVITIEQSGDRGHHNYSITSGPLVAKLKTDLPEVVAATRTFVLNNIRLGRGDRDFDANNPNDGIQIQAMIADPDFFKVFSFRLLKGDPDKILEKPGEVLLTPETAAALFGDEDPIGKPLVIPGVQDAYVAGIVSSPPNNSHIQYGAIGKLRPEQNPVWWDSWENLMLSGYIRTVEGAEQKVLEKKIIKLARENNFAEIYLPKLQPLLDVHLGSAGFQYDFSNQGKNSKSVVYALTIIGIMVLLIAAINFINLSSARSALRAREVGMRKVIGAKRSQLIGQFLGESIILTFLAMLLALAIVQATLPYLDTFLGKHLEINFIEKPAILLLMIAFAVLIGTLSGVYPAMVLSSFKPITVLRGKFKSSGAGVLLRRILVVVQFAIGSALILGVFIVLMQINYIKNLDMGYNRDGLYIVPNFFGQGEDLLKNELKKNPAIEGLGRINGLPGGNPLRIEAIPEGTDRRNSRMFQQYTIDDEILDLLEIEVLKGRKFSREFASDTLENIMVNEAVVKMAGWDEPIGKRLDLIDINGTLVTRRVIGVVKNFHYSNARQDIEPMLLVYNPGQSPLLFARIQGAPVSGIVKQIEAKYRELFPDQQYNGFFFENFYNQQFNDDREFAGNIGLFSGIAIFIACLGLLGLVSFAVEQRRQEMAVRKVLGSAEWRIVFLLSMDLLKWVALANLIAWPLGYLGMNIWLGEFVFKMPFTPWPYLVAALGTILIAMITISFQSIKASRMNPVEHLRIE